MKHSQYGTHLIIDCYEITDFLKLNDIELLFNFLNNLPQQINMEKINLPQMAEINEENDFGISGTIMIKTSHIAIHTYPLKKCFFLDVFSCKKFDTQKVKNIIQNTFQPKKMDTQEIVRGINFPSFNLVQQPKKGK